MADTYTTNLNLTKPEPGAAEDTWGISLNADLDALDAIFSTSGTQINLNPNQINFADNKKAIFGTGNDLQIYHDGSNSIITDAGAGNLELKATNLIFKNSAGTLQYASFISGGAAELRYNGSPKIATTNTGIDITGTVTSDGLTVDGTISAYRAGFTQGVQLLGDSGGNQIIGTATNDKKLIIKNLAATQGIEIIAGNKVMDIARGGDISF